MTPQPPLPHWLLDRRTFLAAGLCSLTGCASTLMRGQSPEVEDGPEEEPQTELVGSFTRATGLNYLKLEAVALVTQLEGTGSDPPPSAQRNMLINEMQSHSVPKPDQILASPDTSLVFIRGFLPPGVRKDEPFDIEVMTPPRSETTSLRGGWLMGSRMRQMAVLGGAVRSGAIEGVGKGRILVDTLFLGDSDKANETRGRIPGGGTSLIDRKLGLAIGREDKSIRLSVAIGKAVNARFYTYEGNGAGNSRKVEVCKPKRDNYLELDVPALYKHNLARYVRVVQSIAVNENPIQRAERLQVLEQRLLDPQTSGQAALQLEAIGKEGISTLKKGLEARDPVVRFYTAEALAYLDVPEAAKPLGEIAAKEQAFRWHALTALTVMGHLAAYEALVDLLHVESIECRYGAFRAIFTRNPRDPSIGGEQLGESFAYHIISTTGQPLIHFARAKRAEVVQFGTEIRLKAGEPILAGKGLTIRVLDDRQVRVSRFSANDNDQQEICGTEIDQVIRAVVRVGGTYAEVMTILNQAKDQGMLDVRLAQEALPTPARAYLGSEEEDTESSDEASVEEMTENAEPEVTTPESELFRNQLDKQPVPKPRSAPIEPTVEETEPRKKRSIWNKMGDRMNEIWRP
jgi:flagellar basal body P-ring protein FlgI